ncbi:MAG: hypothetical protein Kow0037_04030 [Calditrichia bacterium]
MKRALLFISWLFLIIFLSNGFGQTFKKYAGEFMELGTAPRAQAMGGAAVASVSDITASYYNPAALFQINQTQISFMHTQQLIASVNYDYLGIARRHGDKRVWALSMVRLGIDNIKDSRQAQIYFQNDPDNWRIDWNKVTSFNAADYIISLSAAQQWKTNVLVGATVKYIRRDLAEFSANGFGFDAGLLYQAKKNWNLGAHFRNITTTLISWSTGEKELVSPSIALGTAYRFRLPTLNSGFQFAGDTYLRTEGREESAQVNLGFLSFDFAAGIEYDYAGTLFFRAGIDELERLNLGTGFRIPHLKIDYAFTSYDDELGNSHRIGLIVLL